MILTSAAVFMHEEKNSKRYDNPRYFTAFKWFLNGFSDRLDVLKVVTLHVQCALAFAECEQRVGLLLLNE